MVAKIFAIFFMFYRVHGSSVYSIINPPVSKPLTLLISLKMTDGTEPEPGVVSFDLVVEVEKLPSELFVVCKVIHCIWKYDPGIISWPSGSWPGSNMA